MNKQRTFILVAAGIGIIATFLPWITVSAGAFGYNLSQSRNGFHGIGVLYFLLLLAIVAITLTGKQSETLEKNMRLAVMGGAVVSLICLLIARSNDNENTSVGFGGVNASVGVGLGFILCVIATIALVAIPLVIKQAGESLQNDFAALKTTVQSVQEKVSSAANAPRNEQNRMAELEKLIGWRNDGKISQQEFDELKSKII